VFTTVQYWSLSWDKQIEPQPPQNISLDSILIIFSHVRLGLSGGRFSTGFATKTSYVLVFSSMCATFPVHHILVDLNNLNISGEEYKLRSSSLSSILHPPVTSSHLGSNILLSTLFPNSLFSALNIRDKISHPRRTTGDFVFIHVTSRF
jgi:hypothetical protein